MDKYCSYHRDHGHTTDDCRNLKAELEYWARRGMLKDFTTSPPLPLPDRRCIEGSSQREGLPLAAGKIHTL